MGGATVFPRHIIHMHRNYSDTMAALQTSPNLTCLLERNGDTIVGKSSVNHGINPASVFILTLLLSVEVDRPELQNNKTPH